MAGSGIAVYSGEGGACLDSDISGRSLRLTLLRGEALRVPKASRALRVLSGTAWVSLEGEDLVLARCESLSLPGRRGHQAVVSSAGEEALLLELERGSKRLVLS
jgi:hypothetical protein